MQGLPRLPKGDGNGVRAARSTGLRAPLCLTNLTASFPGKQGLAPGWALAQNITSRVPPDPPHPVQLREGSRFSVSAHTKPREQFWLVLGNRCF